MQAKVIHKLPIKFLKKSIARFQIMN